MSEPRPLHQPVPTHPPPGGWAPPGVPVPSAAGAPPEPVTTGSPRRHPHPEPREYHRMLRTWNYAWWRPTVGVILVAVLALVVAPIAVLPVLAIGIWLEGGPFWDGFERALSMQEITPVGLLYLNLALGAMILVTWLVVRLLHGLRPRWLTSVVPRMRWRFLAACVGLSVIALVAQVVVAVFVPGDDTVPAIEPNPVTATTVLLGLVVILTTPLQAAGEEYVFRGYLLQAIGAIFINRWVTILITSLLFALAHGGQNFPLFFDRFMFGFIAAWLVIRTGGLEAGIALHVLNNMLAFGIAILVGDVGESLNVGEISWWNIPVTLTQAGVYAVLVVWVARRMGVQRETDPPRFARAAEPRVSSDLGS